MRRGYVVFTEDKRYLLWQTELLINSLQKNANIDLKDIVVLFADPTYHSRDGVSYQPTNYLKSIISHYNQVNYHCVQNFGRRNWYFRFTNEGNWHPKQYPGINKWTSLCEAANAGWLDKFDEVLLIEQDLWFSGKVPDLPSGNCVTDNWINSRYRAFEVTDKDDKMNTPGFDLDDIMKLCKVKSKDREKWVGGAIIFKFITEQLKKARFLNSIVNYNQLLMTLGELALPQGARHETDMVAPNLAMAHCGMDCTLVDDLCWRSDVWTWHQEPPVNVVVHYGWDFVNYKHLGSTFNKFKYGSEYPWVHAEQYEKEIHTTKFNWVKSFLRDIISLGDIKIDRSGNDRVVAVPTI